MVLLPADPTALTGPTMPERGQQQPNGPNGDHRDVESC
jgi:hypothetical protein